MSILFTQYLRPDGRTTPVTIDMDEEIERKADKIIEAGYRFECEVLTTGHVSFTIHDPREVEDVAIKVVPNDETVPVAVRDMIIHFHGILEKREQEPAAPAGTPLPRTQEELVARLEEALARDMFGFEGQEYFMGLTFDSAKPFLREGVVREDYPEAVTVERLSEQSKSYLSFWLEKIENERGISVVRATLHFVAWKWMLGHPDADTFPGAPQGPDGGWYQRAAFEYIRKQVDTGEWDRLTQEALKAKEG